LKDSQIEYEFFWLISRSGEFHEWGLLPDTRYLTSVPNGIDKTFRGYADAILDRVAAKYPEESFKSIGKLMKQAGYTGRPTEKAKAEQAGTGQPATQPVVELEGGDKPQPEAEGRCP
jgi:hypothetical protein